MYYLKKTFKIKRFCIHMGREGRWRELKGRNKMTTLGSWFLLFLWLQGLNLGLHA